MRILIACISLLFSCHLSAQLNPSILYVDGKTNHLNSVSIKSTGFTPTVISHPLVGSDSLSIYPIGGNDYSLNYQGPSDFLGDAKMVIEYYEPSPIPGINTPNYVEVHFRIEKSLIVTQDDYLLVSSDTATYDILANDSSSDGALTLEHLGAMDGGTAIISSNKIDFVLSPGKTNGFVRYFVSDSTDNIQSGLAYFTRQDETAQTAKSLYVDNKSSIYLHLSSENYELDTNPQKGYIENINNSHIWKYDPYDILTGVDSFSFSTPQGGREGFNIEILNKSSNASFVVDDEYFAATNDLISFNVFDNDYRNDLQIFEHSPELLYNGNGQFSYTPPADFSGDKNFYYKIFTPLGFHTGEILIHIDDFGPSDDVDYRFEVLKDHDLTFRHSSPIDDYTFELLVAPSNGQVLILDDQGQEVLECDTITRDNTIIYLPYDGFSGLDEFDLEYCTTSGVCDIVKVDINVLDSNYDACLCINSCVYPGDNNDDGVVDMKDLIDLGLNLGEAGYDRTNDFPLFWTGQESSDWGYTQMSSSIDLKCGDSDGNGFIDSDDITEISDNYGQMHNMRSDVVGSTSNVPIYFIPPAGPIDSGEWLILDIAIGTGNLPALDFYGSSFTFNFDPSLVDSASVEFITKENSWLTYESPVQSMFVVPQDGQIDIGVTRITNNSADGLGIIGQLKFIVEDEVVGFKRSQIEDVLNLKMTNIISSNEYGEFSIHKDFERDIVINYGDRVEEQLIYNSVQLYPNPSTGIVNIHSSKYGISNIEITDVYGRSLGNYAGNKTIDISAYPQGIYFFTITSMGQRITKKIQKIDY